MRIRFEKNVACFPSQGTLLVCSDLQGNLHDFERLEAIFRSLHATTNDAYLLFLGDLIHGQYEYTEQSWPDWLGTYYPDQSIELVERFLQLETEFPGRVTSLLGNHEHSQIGGIWLRNFSDQFETDAGERLSEFKTAFQRFPLVALAPCGVAFSHACPSLGRGYSISELADVEYAGDYAELLVLQMVEHEPLGPLIWSRCASAEEASSFLQALSRDNATYHISVCGHDPDDEGYDKPAPNQLVLSTSYRMKEESKTYLRLELGETYRDVTQLREGRELLLLS